MLSKMTIRGELLLAIPMSILNEEWAQRNHGQSLSRLNERGGLGASEALAIAEKREWKRFNELLAELELMVLIVGAYVPAGRAALKEGQ